MRTLIAILVFLVLISCKESVQSNLQVDTDAEAKDEVELPFSEDIKLPTSDNAHLPRLKAHGDKLHMTWVEQEDSLAVLKYAYYADAKWSSPETVASGTDWFVNWADFPAVAENNGTVITHFLQKSAEGTYDYDIKVVLRDAETGTWSAQQTLHNDGIAAEHGFVSFLPYGENYFLATWLDGRNTKSGSHGDTHDSHSSAGGAMTLRSARIGFGGTITNRTELDHRICDCCNTAITMTDMGAMVVYRDRSEAENEVRDIYTTRWIEDGWTTPVPVHNDNWKINGCPVNGPAVDAKGKHVITAWFTAADDDPRVLASFSQDSGDRFTEPIRLDAGNAIGRVDTVSLEDGTGLVSWLEPNEENVLLQVVHVSREGKQAAPITIANTSASRASGFPQLEVVGDRAYVAWTDVGDVAKIKMTSFRVH